MGPPTSPTSATSLMRMHGERVGRGWMEPDPDIPITLEKVCACVGLVALCLLAVFLVTYINQGAN